MPTGARSVTLLVVTSIEQRAGLSSLMNGESSNLKLKQNNMNKLTFFYTHKNNKVKVWTIDDNNISSDVITMSKSEWNKFRKCCFCLGIRFTWI